MPQPLNSPSSSGPLQRERPSVADLRKSFEQFWQPTEVIEQSKTVEDPISGNENVVRHSTSGKYEHALDTDRTNKEHSQTSVPRTLGSLTGSQSVNKSSTEVQLKHRPDCGQASSPVKCIPSLRLRSRSSHPQISLLSRSNTLKSPSPSKPVSNRIHEVLDGLERRPRDERDLDIAFTRSNPFPHLSYGEIGEIAIDDGFTALHSSRDIPDSRLTHTRSNRRSKDSGTQTHSSFPAEACMIAKEKIEPAITVPRTSKVAELRRLFDRSSPRSFMPFSRRQRHTLLATDAACQSPCQETHTDSELSTSAMSTTMTRKSVTPPALTTEISVNDFTCSFGIVEGAQEAHSPRQTLSKTDTSCQSSLATSRESPIKNRINHFELLHSRSESLDNNLELLSEGKKLSSERQAAASKTPGARENRHPPRNIWRRISQSLTQTLEGVHLREHYHSSFQESSTSSDYSYLPSYHKMFPLPPARKSYSFMQRFAHRATDNAFGLDGANQSTLHVPDADVFSSTRDGAASSKPTQNQQHNTAKTSGDGNGAINNPALPTHDELRRRAAQQEREKRKEQKKQNKKRTREERKRRIAQRRHSRQVSSREVSGQVEKQDTDRKWKKQTASGFVVREARLPSGELVAPKPHRPGQVKNIVNFYKERSSSLLRIASGGHFGGSKCQLDGGNENPAKDQKSKKEKEKGKGKEK
jgi:hypothetical protein